MKNHIEELKKGVKHNTKKIIKLLIVTSFLGAGLNLVVARLKINSIILAVMVAVNFAISLAVAYFLYEDKESISVMDFLSMLKNKYRIIMVLEVLKLLAVAIWFFILKGLSASKIFLGIAQPVTAIMYILLTYADFKANFYVFEGKGISLNIISEIWKDLIKNRKAFYYVLLKIFVIFMCGMIAVTLFIIFIYSLEISEFMKTAVDYDSSILDPYFSTPLSNFIQSFGAQIIVSLASVWIASLCLFIRGQDKTTTK